ncbi:unnamed protein product [Plutella xylostella]|uniref:(diamondback moth) hypothetical protein n=1 Tax=Plutella xylostella TaxID=51655 RepID=A0A8S4G8U5_PLUXY|nr:unnamed protein product [Plutella xylostella]
MKSFAFIVLFAQAALLQGALGQYIKSCGCGSNLGLPILAPAPCAGPAPVVIQSVPNVIQTVPNVIQTVPSVYQAAPNVVALPPTDIAGSLADTLSLLTVSSLLAEKLPLGLPQIVNVAAPVVPSCGCGYNLPAPVIPSCGCGYNAYNNYGSVFF